MRDIKRIQVSMFRRFQRSAARSRSPARPPPRLLGWRKWGQDQPLRVTNWTEFQRYFGSFITDGYMAHSVFQYFNNGWPAVLHRAGRPLGRCHRHVTVQNRAAVPVAG